MPDSVAFTRVGNTATITVTVDVTDLAANTGASKADLVNTMLARAVVAIQNQQAAQTNQAAALAAQIATLQAQQAILPVQVKTF